MATIQKDRILQFRGQDLRGRDGEKIGSIEEIYLDTQTGEPEWALVQTGLFGSKQTFVPLHDATEGDNGLEVPFDKSQVKDAPKMDPDGQLSQRDEAELYRHYGLEYSEAESDTGLASGGTGGDTATTTGRSDADANGMGSTGTALDASASGTSATGTGRGDADSSRTSATGTGETARGEGDTGTSGAAYGGAATTGDDISDRDTDDAMTRSEEELSVGTRDREAGRARLRKYVVTDEVEETVPVRREEVRLEREPITDENREAAMRGPDISEAEHEVVLHEEEPVAEKRVVPKERVRLDKDVETDERTVSEEVAREQIDVDGDARDDR
jgi:stress response protein YsnF